MMVLCIYLTENHIARYAWHKANQDQLIRKMKGALLIYQDVVLADATKYLKF